MVSQLRPLFNFLSLVRKAYEAFDTHSVGKRRHTLRQPVPILHYIKNETENMAKNITARFNINTTALNGSWGSVSAYTLNSIGGLKDR